MNKKQEIGKLGENLATKYLKQNKYVILDRNFRCKQGEIDIIAIDSKQIIFVEVKTRTNLSYGNPSEAVHKLKRLHMKKVAKYYLYINNITKIPIRFDVIEIYIKNQKYKINHIKQII